MMPSSRGREHVNGISVFFFAPLTGQLRATAETLRVGAVVRSGAIM